MQTLTAHIDMATDIAIKLKFEGTLDHEIKTALAESLVDQLMSSKEFRIVKQDIHPTMSDPFATGVRYYTRVEVRNATF